MVNMVYWVFVILLIYLLGASVGSFLLVTIMRGHRHEKWATGRSVCEHCGKELQWWELIPTISFLVLQGKCSKCKSKIDPTHFISETGLGLIYIAIFAGAITGYIQPSLAVSYLIACTVLWKNVMSDLLYYEVSSIDTYIAAIIVGVINGCWQSVVVLIILDIFLMSQDNFSTFGAGDIDIVILIYATLGSALQMVNVMFYASLIAAIIYFMFMRKAENKQIAFVPFMFSGFILTTLGFGLV